MVKGFVRCFIGVKDELMANLLLSSTSCRYCNPCRYYYTRVQHPLQFVSVVHQSINLKTENGSSANGVYM
jgi:hypothetical protein